MKSYNSFAWMKKCPLHAGQAKISNQNYVILLYFSNIIEHAGNVLWTDDGPHFVDFDDSRMGPAVQDLWMLLSGERADMVRQMSDVLAGYEDFCDFEESELHLVEALRTLRLIHYSAWLAQRWDDPAFKQAFPWFNTQRYWQDRVLELREQVALMQEPPLWQP
jgi:Ser/Thr protein kinase RdoA (MazF antagonist)